ncbi:hypothetical protein AB0B45_18930 [Nonomuraea sp. NPDC049152]|uniref:hypothetical protein n=1 Tax=Nonomuraea sp. NPDC049152 TaxID=3154350 RepID=UPI0033D09272
MPLLLGLLGLGLAALALGIFLGRCDYFGLFPLAVTGYIAGTALIGGALVMRFRHSVAISIILLLGVVLIAGLVSFWAFFAAFARCFEL